MKYPVLTVVTLGLLAACSQKSPHVETRAADPGKDSHHSQSDYAKPGAQVSLVGDKLLYLEPGATGDWVLTLASTHQQGQMHVGVTASAGLELGSGQQQFAFSLAPQGLYAIPLTLGAPTPGRYYVHLQIELAAEGRQSTRALSAIVQVGDVKAERQQTQSKGEVDSQGRPLIIQKVEESVRH